MKENLTVSLGVSTDKLRVRCSYTLEPETLANLLQSLRLPGDLPGQFTDTPMNIADVPQAKIDRVAYLATVMADDKLQAWVRTKNYHDITSAASYRGSSVGNFNAEGTRAFEVRDATWAALYTYLGGVLAGVIPVPTKVEEIEAVLPAMTWL
jgi:hypothetical protein